MTGVEILATEEVAVAFGFNFYTWMFLTVLGILVCGLIGTITLFDDLGWKATLIGMGFGLLVGGFFGLIPAVNSEPIEYETQYKVTISDEVPMNEFLERYEIIDQEGKIYTVREIKDGN